MKRLLICVCFLFVLLNSFASGSKIALIINLPTDSNITDDKRQRDFAINDSVAISDVLQNISNYDVILIDKFTKANEIKNILSDLCSKSDLQSLFFYYSGYATKVDKHILFTTDHFDENNLDRCAIDYRLFIDSFNSISRNTQVSSFFNYIYVNQSNSEQNNFSIKAEKNIMEVRANGNQFSIYENYDKKHSAFAFFLTEAMRGQADINEDGYLSFDEILQYLSHNYQSYIARNNSKQHSTSENYYYKSTTVQSNGVTTSIRTDFNARFNEAFDNEFGSLNRPTQPKKDNNLLRVDQVQFFNTKTLGLCKEFSQKTTTYIGIDVLLHLQQIPDPHKKISVSIYLYYPDGSLMGKLDKLCRPILSVEGGMFCRTVYGWDESGHWPAGKYTVKIGYNDCVLYTSHFNVQ